jgi:hypothetical protein
MRVLPGWEESAGGSDLDVELDERADADGARVMSFVGKATETPAQRSITGNTILLRSHEFSQYLPWSWHQLTRPGARRSRSGLSLNAIRVGGMDYSLRSPGSRSPRDTR